MYTIKRYKPVKRASSIVIRDIMISIPFCNNVVQKCCLTILCGNMCGLQHNSRLIKEPERIILILDFCSTEGFRGKPELYYIFYK
jgi:hypothetical protein